MRANQFLTVILAGVAGCGLSMEAAPASELATRIQNIRVFPQPLQPAGGNPGAGAEVELVLALETLQRSKGHEVKPLQAYLDRHPESPWRLSLLVQLGSYYRQSGYLSRAVAAWTEAWDLGKGSRDEAYSRWADLAGTELAELLARLGRTDELEVLLRELSGRSLRGPASERVAYSRESLDRMKTTPERNYRCGPLSLAMLSEALGRPESKLLEERGAPSGTSMAYNQDLAARYGLTLQALKRDLAVLPPLPSVIHLRSGHFATIIREANGRFLVKDPTFGDDAWIIREALDDEWSGYVLALGKTTPIGFQVIDRTEAATVFGKGGAPLGDPNQNGECNTQTGGQGCQDAGGCKGMPRHTFHSLLASLFIRDTPVGYAPSLGPAVFFSISYSQRDVIQPASFNHSNIGSKWRFNYQAYVLDDPTVAIDTPTVSMMVKLHGMGGGLKPFVFDRVAGAQPPSRPETGPSKPQADDRTVLVRSGLTSYTRYFPDGSQEIYTHPDGAFLYPRRVFLTAVVDPAGSRVVINYDNRHRITSIVDAQGRATSLAYENADLLKVTKVTDPFGRSARFEYDSGGQLFRVTDVAGLSSEFYYGSTTEGPTNPVDFIHTMKTPYGSYQYFQGSDADGRWVEAVDPLGGRERAEFKRHPILKANDAQLMPPGFISRYPGGSFYWNQRVMALYPRDYNRAQHTRWVWGADGEGSVDIPHSLKGSESVDTYQTWFTYPGQESANLKGTLSLPSQVIRNTGDGFQTWRYEYNNLGRPTKVIDPLGRETTMVYAPNLMDLVEVRQTSNGRNDSLARYTYNAQHLPLTATDTAGQVTRFTYNSAGQLTSLTNPLGQGTLLTYNPQGQLEKVEGPGGRSSRFTYDQVGRVWTVTDPEGEIVTLEYDALDRPSKVTYSDGTFEQLVYDRLDVASRRDRTGRWTTMAYNALRQLVEVKDALGRVTRLDWCGCGTLDSLIDPMGRVTNWVRDLDNHVIAKILPDRTHTAFRYDLLGRLVERVDAKGQVTAYDYYSDNTLAQISYANSRRATSSAPVRFTYERDYNRLSTMVDGTGTTQYAYHPIGTPTQLGAGRLASETSSMANSAITYGYDELGLVVSRSINGANATISYDALGRPSQATNALGSFTFGFEGTTARLSALGLPNGMTTAFSYYDATQQHRLKEIHHQTSSNSTVSKFSYAYDPFGQINSWAQQADAQAPKTYTFSYDAVGQLLDAKLNGTNGELLRSFLYGYDASGNRTSSTVDGQSTSAEYNDANQLKKLSTAPETAPIKAGGKAPLSLKLKPKPSSGKSSLPMSGQKVKPRTTIAATPQP